MRAQNGVAGSMSPMEMYLVARSCSWWSGLLLAVLNVRFVLCILRAQIALSCFFSCYLKKESHLGLKSGLVWSTHLMPGSHKLEIQEGELKFLTSFLIEILVLTVFQVYLIYRRLIILMTLREVSLCLEKKKDYWKKVQRRWEGLRWYVVLRRDLEQRPWFVQQVCSKPSRLEGMWKCLVHDLLMLCLISLVPLPWHLTAISTSSVSAFRQEPAAPEPCVVFPFSKIHQGKCFSWRQECSLGCHSALRAEQSGWGSCSVL